MSTPWKLLEECNKPCMFTELIRSGKGRLVCSKQLFFVCVIDVHHKCKQTDSNKFQFHLCSLSVLGSQF